MSTIIRSDSTSLSVSYELIEHLIEIQTDTGARSYKEANELAVDFAKKNWRDFVAFAKPIVQKRLQEKRGAK